MSVTFKEVETLRVMFGSFILILAKFYRGANESPLYGVGFCVSSF